MSVRTRACLRLSGLAIVAALGGVLGGGALAVSDADEAEACTRANYYRVFAGNPYRFDGAAPLATRLVNGSGEITFSGDFICGTGGKFSAQRKVCGFWGCNFETKASDSRAITHGGKTAFQRHQYCNPGVHRYRNTMTMTYVYYDWSDGPYGAWRQGSVSHTSPQPEHRC